MSNIKLINPFNNQPLQNIDQGLKDNDGNFFPCKNWAFRFVKDNNYTQNFGFQWNKFVTTKIDKTANIDFTMKRFFAATCWDKENLEGKNVLEVGSGADRFIQIALDHTKSTFYGLDYSEAVEVNYKNNGPNDRLFLFQTGIYEMPFAKSQFDKVFCFGVLQNTPDIEKSITSLINMAKPGAGVIIDFYLINGWWSKLHIIYFLRPFTKKMTNEKLYGLIDKNIDWLIKANRFFSNIGVGNIINRFLPVCDIEGTLPKNLSTNQMKEMCLLDTFDIFSPKYDQPQKVAPIKKLFKKYGMKDIGGGTIQYNNSKVTLVKGIRQF